MADTVMGSNWTEAVFSTTSMHNSLLAIPWQPQEPTEELKNQLLFTNKELRRWQKLNMLVVDNRG